MKVAVGLSGGVDSAVAALLLKEVGHEVTGVTMRVGLSSDERNVADAAAVAAKLGIATAVVDLSGDYAREVLGYFRATYLAGKTPNPCVRCNELVKFGLLPRLAREQGVDFERFATGHYARVAVREGKGGCALRRAKDAGKDQSYFLYRVPRETLAKVVFPLGDLLKAEVREIARAAGLEVAGRPDSQDFCAGEAIAAVGVEDRVGEIVDVNGKTLGTHRGYWHYTIGKRRGLGVGGGIPYYVVDIDAANNRVIVGFKADAVRTSFAVGDWAGPRPEGRCLVKVRSAGEPKGPVWVEGDACRCPDGMMGVAPGQSAVFYDERGMVLGGGIVR